MTSKRLSQLSREELKQMIVERRTEMKRHELEIKAVAKNLNQLKRQRYQFWDALQEAKGMLGSMNGRHCPALKDSHTTYGKNFICLAKRYKYLTFTREKMYRRHCFACHLTPEQAKTAMLYDRILIGRRKDGE